MRTSQPAMRKVRFQYDNCSPALLVDPLFISLQVQPSKATRGARVTHCDDLGEVQGRCCGCPFFVQGGFKCTVDGLHSLWLWARWMSTSQGLWTHKDHQSHSNKLSPKSKWEENTLAKAQPLFILARLPILLKKRKIVFNLKVKISQTKSCKIGWSLILGVNKIWILRFVPSGSFLLTFNKVAAEGSALLDVKGCVHEGVWVCGQSQTTVGLPQHYQSFVPAAKMPLIYFQRSGCQYNGREAKKCPAFNWKAVFTSSCLYPRL